MRNPLKLSLAVAALTIGAAIIWNTLPRASAPTDFVPDRTAQSALLAGDGTADTAARAEESSFSEGAVAGARRTLFRKVRFDLPPVVAARAVLVADLETGETYVSHNPELRWPIASLTKLITAAEALREISLSTTITLGDAMIAHIGDTALTGLTVGEAYRANDLVAAMMVFSSNEAAEALASFAGRDGFIQGMNQMVNGWGLTHTYFDDPTGLSAANQSTPRDLQAAVLHLYREYPEVFALTRKTSVVLAEQNSGTRVFYPTINEFAGRSDFLGGKTGFTDEAGGNLISLFAYENRPIIIVVLGSDDRFGATEALRSWFTRTYTSR
jgi:D-alanyl-D-alanine endopeptidase (penicillin-binding protein 7)